MQYLLVTFAGDRRVIIDGSAGAWRTNHTLQIEGGTYTVTLDGPHDFAPPQYDIVLQHTTVVAPLTLAFTKMASVVPAPPAAKKASGRKSTSAAKTGTAAKSGSA